jgi:septal ring factor EnvC (AmiA/AmiB activator)
MPYNLVEAGAAVGKSKSAILKAIRRGAISAQRDTATGGWAIDPAELHRAFPAVSRDTSGDLEATRETGETGAMRELRARLNDKDAVIEDLRRQRDRADDERRRAQEQLAAAQERIAALLMDQRAKSDRLSDLEAPARPRRSWW